MSLERGEAGNHGEMARELIDTDMNLAERFVRRAFAGPGARFWRAHEVSSRRTSGSGLQTVQS